MQHDRKSLMLVNSHDNQKKRPVAAHKSDTDKSGEVKEQFLPQTALALIHHTHKKENLKHIANLRSAAYRESVFQSISAAADLQLTSGE